MARKRPRTKTRRHAHANPRGVLKVAADGFGFVQTAEGEFFVPAHKMGGAFDGDLVELVPISLNHDHKQLHKQHNRPGDKPTARVVRVVVRSHDTVVGRYEIAEPFGVVVPEDHHIPYDVFTVAADNPQVKDGDIVRVRMTEYPSRNSAATGVIEEVLGHDGDAGVDVATIIAHHKLETAFSAPSLAQAQRAAVDVEEALANGYRDLRDRFIATIDPVDAKDFDDALSLRKVEDCWCLGVHIADVSSYVTWGSSIDLDARRRATSVYLVDRVIPMLPPALCEDVCSLVPNADRRAMTADIYLNESFQPVKVEFCRSIIRSKARLSYDQAQVILDAVDQGATLDQVIAALGATPQPAAAQPLSRQVTETLMGMLPVLHTIALSRDKQRRDAGGMDFETTEAKMVLDDAGVPQSISLRSKTPATSCVEEAMILANECVARELETKGMPALFRIHETPSPDSLAELLPILQEFDYVKHIDATRFIAGDPKVLQTVSKLSSNRPEAELITNLLLRSMKRAVYSPQCDPHYGLASEAYCHFTSPIRRYPDLVVHRMLTMLLCGRSETFEQQKNSLGWLAEHSSRMERIAETAARESQELKMVEYLQGFIGQAFDGVIAGVATYGVYVRLSNTAEGLVPLRNLGDEYFALNPQLHLLVGQESGTVFRMGQPVSVVLTEAIPRQRKLTFRLSSL